MIYQYGELNFEWDEEKNKINDQKHGITFIEASSVFNDKYAVQLEDLMHSSVEERFIIIGKSNKSKLLLVCHCFRDSETVRIISARKANEVYINLYEEELRWKKTNLSST